MSIRQSLVKMSPNRLNRIIKNVNKAALFQKHFHLQKSEATNSPNIAFHSVYLIPQALWRHPADGKLSVPLLLVQLGAVDVSGEAEVADLHDQVTRRRFHEAVSGGEIPAHLRNPVAATN